MTSEGIKNKSSQDVFEELHKSEEEEKLENDEDLFEDLSPQMSQLSHSKWKFIGDCAWLMPTDGPDGNIVVNNTEADGRPSRKRRRSEPKIEATVVKSEEMDEDEIEEDDENMKPFCCNICARGFHSKEELKTHTCTRTHPKPFECDICRKGFSTKSNMQRHRNIHTKEKVFQCNHCSKKFYDSGNLKRHIEGVHNQKEEMSKSDDEALQISEDNSRSSSLGHVETADLKPIETSVIKKRDIKNESSPKKSQNSNSINQSPSSSTVASSSSSHNVVELSDEEQMRNHDEERISANQILTSLNHTERPHSYTCDRCLLRFDTKEEAIDHLRQSHPGNEQQHCLRVEQPVSKPNEKPFTYKLFYCDFCWKEFTWRANLVRHINIHTHEKIFPCSTCKKTFRRHEQKHQGINYKCAKCSRNFNDPSNLRRHELSCNGEHQLSEDEIEPKKEEKEEVKPHRCGYCSKSFGRAERLEEHLRTHTGETPFKCDICLKGFTTKHNLLRHRNIHTLEKKYTCEICFKYFADPTQHKRHQATHFAKHNKDTKALRRIGPVDG